MTDRPILFSAQMVRALLEGRKTQTRRVVKRLRRFGEISEFGPSDTKGYDWHFRDAQKRWHDLRDIELKAALPWQIDDRLWVKEAVACGACASLPPSCWAPSFWRREQGSPRNRNGLWYRADGLSPDNPITERGPWRSPIHMPRWAARIGGTITDVRVQRLQDIDEADAKAEGLVCLSKDQGRVWKWGLPERDGLPGSNGWDWQMWCVGHRPAYAKLWDSLHGADAWAANPYVVALTFTVTLANIDAADARRAPEAA